MVLKQQQGPLVLQKNQKIQLLLSRVLKLKLNLELELRADQMLLLMKSILELREEQILLLLPTLALRAD